MATEAWVALFIAICLPLIGFAWANMQARITRVETKSREHSDALEVSLRKEVHDRHQDNRHRIENVQTQLADMLLKENRELSTQMIKSIDLMVEMLRKPATDEILARRSIHRNERNET